MRPAKPVKSAQWTDLSIERRELGRAAGKLAGVEWNNRCWQSCSAESNTIPDPGGAHDSIFHIDRMEAATKLHW